MLTIAYLARGKVHLKTREAATRTIESAFGESVRERALSIEQRNAWKTEGRGAQFLSGGALWGVLPQKEATLRVAITSLSRGRNPGDLLYTVETDEVAGVFAWHEAAGREQRLLHGTDCRIRDVRRSPGGPIACAVTHPWTANIAVMREDGSDLREATEGDSQDRAPSWVGESRVLVFQSAGIARDATGNFQALGPFAIQKLDLDNGELVTLAEDPRHDLLAPQLTTEGALYYIRRPYTRARGASLLRVLLELVLFPFRLVYAIIQALNFFSLRHTGRPLTSSGDARQKEMDLQRMMIWGNLIDARKAARDAAAEVDGAGLVPASWQLVRAQDGRQVVLARGVVSFDLASDGAVVYSNGNAIFRLAPGGSPERLLEDRLIEQVVVVHSADD